MCNTYPTLSDYIEVFQHLSFVVSDPAIKVANIDKNSMDIPILLSGNFAVISGATVPSGKRYALRCFYKHVPDIEIKYDLISNSISGFELQTPNYFVHFEYQNKGIKVQNKFYPLIKMDWVAGQTLGAYVEKNFNNPNSLQYLLSEFQNLYKFLKQNNIAHGDIQNGNVIITDLGIKLVDYDGMFVSGMKEGQGSEIGHPHFQHPKREEKHFGPAIDEFSFMVVHLSLSALIKDSYLSPFYNQENIIFTKNDFLDPSSSLVFNQIKTIPDLQCYAERLSNICLAPYEKIPTFNEYLQGKNIPTPTLTPIKQNTFVPQPVIQNVPSNNIPQQSQQQKQPVHGLSTNYPFRSSTTTSSSTGCIASLFGGVAKLFIFLILLICIRIVFHLLHAPLLNSSNTPTTINLSNVIKEPNVNNRKIKTFSTYNKNNETILYKASISDVSDFVNMRSTPSISMDNIVTKLYSGDQVNVINLESNGWYKIIAENTEGYIYAGLLDNNTYPSALPIAKITKNGLMAFNMKGEHYDIIKRLVVEYQDNLNYYLKTEKGNLIQTNKDYVVVINKQNQKIPYINEVTRDNIEYIAGLLPDEILKNTNIQEETSTNNYNQPDNNEENSKEISLIDGKKSYPDTKDNYDEKKLQDYYYKLSNAIYSQWKQPYVIGKKTVLVEFKISQNGYFTDINVKQSSGLKEVDDSVISAVNSTQPFELPPLEYNGDYITLPVTIEGY